MCEFTVIVRIPYRLLVNWKLVANYMASQSAKLICNFAPLNPILVKIGKL